MTNKMVIKKIRKLAKEANLTFQRSSYSKKDGTPLYCFTERGSRDHILFEAFDLEMAYENLLAGNISN